MAFIGIELGIWAEEEGLFQECHVQHLLMSPGSQDCKGDAISALKTQSFRGDNPIFPINHPSTQFLRQKS